MKTLYVSDLDGTLLNSGQITSEYTNSVINALVEKGELFSFATARSYSTARKATNGISVNIPISVYNGTFIVNSLTGEKLISNYFENDIADMIKALLENGISPIVYSVIDTEEKFSYLKDKCSEGQKSFIESRKGDKRDNPVGNEADLFNGQIFYISCIDDDKILLPLYEKYKDKYRCLFQKDIYYDTYWLEFMPRNATKADSVLQLKKLLNCDRVVAFGDGLNDLDMFSIADECYAVANAVDELKQAAVGIIESNDNDGVVKWLCENVLNHLYI